MTPEQHTQFSYVEIADSSYSPVATGFRQRGHAGSRQPARLHSASDRWSSWLQSNSRSGHRSSMPARLVLAIAVVASVSLLVAVCSLVQRRHSHAFKIDEVGPIRPGESWRTWAARVYENKDPSDHEKVPADALAAWQLVTPGFPTQGHLSFTGDPTQMRVMWTTRASAESVVKFWVCSNASSNGTAEMSAVGTSKVFTSDLLCGSPATDQGWTGEYFNHDVLLTRLSPSTRYCYTYGSPQHGWARDAYFWSAPTQGSLDTVRIAILGDTGENSSEAHVAETWKQLRHFLPSPPGDVELPDEKKEKEAVRLAVHVGDLSYSWGEQQRWDRFMDEIEPFATHLPYQVAAGNHEIQPGDSGGECGAQYYARFAMPEAPGQHEAEPAIPSNRSADAPPGITPRNLWYSFNYGPIHFLVMSTEHNFFPDTAQFRFLQQDLSSVDRAVTPWIVFVGHRPMYSSNGKDVTGGIRQVYEDLLAEHKVDVAFWGHVHSYERTCPVRKGKCSGKHGNVFQAREADTVHTVVGASGKDLTSWEGKAPEWSHKRFDDKYGFGVLQASGTRLLFQFIGSSNGKVHDEFEIRKDM